MQSDPRQSQRTPAEWTGAPGIMAKWLARRCAMELTANLVGGIAFLVFGLVALVFTSCLAAGIILLILVEANAPLSLIGISVFPVKSAVFIILFLIFLGLSMVHAYKTRWGTDSAANVDLGTALTTFTSLGWEFFSSGPILLILSGQEFYRYSRLSQLEVPQVSALLLWIYDKGGRATFAEICLNFPGLNAVRVLPQLRDLSGINRWPEDGAVSLSEALRKTFAEILGRESKSSPASSRSSRERERPHYQEPVAEVDKDILAWYAALRLPVFASFQQVKSQYRKLAKIHHPDAQSGRRADGHTSDGEQMKRINEAYHNILKHSKEQVGTGHET
jgi:DnaJ-domain-containing protein 1